jgi:hypothetical protein
MENTLTKDVILCDCNSSEHQMLIFYDKTDEDKNVYLHVHLSDRGFIERVKYAFKYIFGYKCAFGAWDEFILNPDDADKFQTMVDYLRTTKNEK